MVEFSFPLMEFEYFLLILTRVSCFVFAAPFFSMNNTPRNVRICLSVFISIILYSVIYPHEALQYSSILTYTILVLKEAIVGLLLGLSGQFCMMIVNFAGQLVDVEIGLSMASTIDPMTKQNTTITGFLYQYAFTLLLIVTGMYRYLLQALADTFTLIPVGKAEFIMQSLYDSFLSLMSDYILLGFRIALPVFCTILVLNGILGVMAKVSPQMNMFSVGLQLKVLTGLGILFVTAGLMPKASTIVFEQMKIMLVQFVEALGGA